MRKLVGLAIAAALLCGCYTIRYTTHLRPTGTVQDEQWQHSFINGLITASPPTNVSQICPAGVAVVENEISFVNGLLSALVQGAVGGVITERTNAVLDPVYVPYTGSAFSLNFQIWTPSTVRVMCAVNERPAAPPQSPVEPPPQPR